MLKPKLLLAVSAVTGLAVLGFSVTVNNFTVFVAGLEADVESAVASEESQPVTEGRALVTTYCSDCHAVGSTGESPHPRAPRFRELYLRYNVEDLSEALVEGISTHPDMPEFEFDPDQAAATVKYLQSLEPSISPGQ